MSGWLAKKSMRRLAATLLVAFSIVLVFLVFALQPKGTEDFPEELRIALADSPRGFLPDDLRDGTIYLGMPQNHFGDIYRPIPMTQFDELNLITRGSAPLNLPIGKAHVSKIILKRDAVSAFYEDELMKIMQNCFATFGSTQNFLIANAENAIAPIRSRNSYLIWHFDDIEVYLEYTPPDLADAQMNNPPTKATVALPPVIMLYFKTRRDAEHTRANVSAEFRPPTPDELDKDFALWDRICKETADSETNKKSNE